MAGQNEDAGLAAKIAETYLRVDISLRLPQQTTLARSEELGQRKDLQVAYKKIGRPGGIDLISREFTDTAKRARNKADAVLRKHSRLLTSPYGPAQLVPEIYYGALRAEFDKIIAEFKEYVTTAPLEKYREECKAGILGYCKEFSRSAGKERATALQKRLLERLATVESMQSSSLEANFGPLNLEPTISSNLDPKAKEEIMRHSNNWLMQIASEIPKRSRDELISSFKTILERDGAVSIPLARRITGIAQVAEDNNFKGDKLISRAAKELKGVASGSIDTDKLTATYNDLLRQRRLEGRKQQIEVEVVTANKVAAEPSKAKVSKTRPGVLPGQLDLL